MINMTYNIQKDAYKNKLTFQELMIKYAPIQRNQLLAELKKRNIIINSDGPVNGRHGFGRFRHQRGYEYLQRTD